MSRVRVRRYKEGDAESLAQIFFRSVHEGARADYTREQVDAWATEAPSPALFEQRARDGRSVFVAKDDDGVVAYGDLEPDGHIDHLYCAPEYIGSGVGSVLYDAVEALAIRQGIARLYVEASESARRLFERKGFRCARDKSCASAAYRCTTISWTSHSNAARLQTDTARPANDRQRRPRVRTARRQTLCPISPGRSCGR